MGRIDKTYRAEFYQSTAITQKNGKDDNDSSDSDNNSNICIDDIYDNDNDDKNHNGKMIMII